MNRFLPTPSEKICSPDIKQRTAIHEAGHAIAIYVGNRKKQLPPVVFHINLQHVVPQPSTPSHTRQAHEHWHAKIEGGRLINNLQNSSDKAFHYLSPAEKQNYQLALEADIINLFVGPLAEAIYVAQRDDEFISPQLIPIQALRNYGGGADLEAIEHCMDCFITEQKAREKKITELFLAAYRFVSEKTHWNSIVNLAHYMLSKDKSVISHQEVGLIITQPQTHAAVLTKILYTSNKAK